MNGKTIFKLRLYGTTCRSSALRHVERCRGAPQNQPRDSYY